MPHPEGGKEDGHTGSLPTKERDFVTQPLVAMGHERLLAVKKERSGGPEEQRAACRSRDRSRSKQSSLSIESDRYVEKSTCFADSTSLHPIVDSLTATQSTTMVSHWQWQRWLSSWEERQEVLFKRHEDTTREIVVAAVKDLSDKMRSCERAKSIMMLSERPRLLSERPRSPHTSNIAAHLLEHSSEQSSFKEKLSKLSREVLGPSREPQPSQDLPDVQVKQASMIAKEFSSSVSPVSPMKSRISIPAPSRRLKTPSKPKTRVRAVLLQLVHHRFFIGMSSTMIAIYTCVVGVMAHIDMRAAAGGQDSPAWLLYTDSFFSIAFALEVLMKVLAESSFFFRSVDRVWNVFDLSLACLGLTDVLSVFSVNLSFLRVLRAFRAVRVLRVLRAFPCFKELRLMAESICSCMVSLSWAVVLLFAVMYIFAVVLLRGASDSLRSLDGLELKHRQVLQEDFGSLPVTLFSLTQAVSGGRSWGEYAEPFIQISSWFAVCFPLFIVFVIFGAMNILTGIFVENTTSIASFDKDLAVEEEMSRVESTASQIRDFFEELDEDRSGTLSLVELERGLLDDRVRAYFSVLQMNVTDAADLFQLLDHDVNGEVSIEEFVLNCMWLRGGPRNMDVANIMRDHRRLENQVRKMSLTVDRKLGELVERVGTSAAQTMSMSMSARARDDVERS